MKRTLLLALALIAVGCGPDPIDMATLQLSGSSTSPPESSNGSGFTVGERWTHPDTGVEYIITGVDSVGGVVDLDFYLWTLGEKWTDPDSGDEFIVESINEDGTPNFDIWSDVWLLNDQPYSGPVYSIHENGYLDRAGSLKDGKQHGSWDYYWAHNGSRMERRTYKDGVLHGPTSTDVDGKLKFEGRYKNGEECGEWAVNVYMEEVEFRHYPPC